jgi:hypothetical protein
MEGELEETGAGVRHGLFIAYGLDIETDLAKSYFPKPRLVSLARRSSLRNDLRILESLQHRLSFKEIINCK